MKETMEMYCLRMAALLAVGQVLILGNAWGQSASNAPAVSMVECFDMQGDYLRRVELEHGKETRDIIAEVSFNKRRPYINSVTRPGPATLVDQIRSGLEKLENAAPNTKSAKDIEIQLNFDLVQLCWLDHYAGRGHSFGKDVRAAYIPELRAKQHEKRAAEDALELARPDDPKTLGRGTQGG